jgi:hypothetical protein
MLPLNEYTNATIEELLDAVFYAGTDYLPTIRW